MGGRGSGTWYRWDTKTKLDEGLQLNMNRIIRCKTVMPGIWHSGAWAWTNTKTGEQTASISYEVNTCDPADMWIRLRYTQTCQNEKHDMDYKVRLATTTPHYGGKRFWFICPQTGKRTSILYSPPGSKWFASRHAYNLKYASQSEGPHDRVISRKFRLQGKLGGENYYRKPKGMHQKTYDRLLGKYWKAEEEADRWLCSEFQRRFGYLP